MSALADRLAPLIAEQRRDGEVFDRLLAESNRALDAGDLATANARGNLAEGVMARIRIRSRHMADVLNGVAS